jgi:hypothetical protein
VAGLAERLAARGFEVVVPSLPGFAFSAQRPERTDPWSTPELWHRLMTEILSYERYGAHGGERPPGRPSRGADLRTPARRGEAPAHPG